jgi:hypothetical protein
MRSLAIATSLALGLLLAAAGAAVAQEASHPSHIHVGSCPAPGDVVVSLWDVSADLPVDGEVSAGATVGSGSGASLVGAVTTVEMPLFDILASEHAIVVHRSADDMGTYLVCGDLGGPFIGTGEVPVALEPVGMSGWSGIGLLRDNGDGTTSVSVFMLEAARPPDDADDDDDTPFDDDDDTTGPSGPTNDDRDDDSAPSRDDDSAPGRDDDTDD